jgi:hypothetical protein
VQTTAAPTAVAEETVAVATAAATSPAPTSQNDYEEFMDDDGPPAGFKAGLILGLVGTGCLIGFTIVFCCRRRRRRRAEHEVSGRLEKAGVRDRFTSDNKRSSTVVKSKGLGGVSGWLAAKFTTRKQLLGRFRRKKSPVEKDAYEVGELPDNNTWPQRWPTSSTAASDVSPVWTERSRAYPSPMTPLDAVVYPQELPATPPPVEMWAPGGSRFSWQKPTNSWLNL